MNLKDVLMIRASGKILPEAKLQSNLFGMKLSGGSEPIPPGCIAYWDFRTGKGEWVDKVGELTISHTGVSLAADGAHFTARNHYLKIPASLGYASRGFEIVLKSMDCKLGSNTGCLFTTGPWGEWTMGLRRYGGASGRWEISGSGTKILTGLDANYFVDSILRLDVDASKKWSLYKDGELLDNTITVNNGSGQVLEIGTQENQSYGMSFFDMVIESLRVYDLTQGG